MVVFSCRVGRANFLSVQEKDPQKMFFAQSFRSNVVQDSHRLANDTPQAPTSTSTTTSSRSPFFSPAINHWDFNAALLRFNAALAARTQRGHVLLLNSFFISTVLARMSRVSVMRLHVASATHHKYPVLALISISAK